MNPVNAHVFIPSVDVPPDVHERRWGTCCPLPEDNQVHKPPDRPPNDRSKQILGEREDE